MYIIPNFLNFVLILTFKPYYYTLHLKQHVFHEYIILQFCCVKTFLINRMVTKLTMFYLFEVLIAAIILHET